MGTFRRPHGVRDLGADCAVPARGSGAPAPSIRRYPAPTFVFADLVGYGALTEQRGDEAAMRVAREFRRVMRALSHEHGAWHVKSMGDGAMICVPDASRAVALAGRTLAEVGARRTCCRCGSAPIPGPPSCTTETGMAAPSMSPRAWSAPPGPTRRSCPTPPVTRPASGSGAFAAARRGRPARRGLTRGRVGAGAGPARVHDPPSRAHLDLDPSWTALAARCSPS